MPLSRARLSAKTIDGCIGSSIGATVCPVELTRCRQAHLTPTVKRARFVPGAYLEADVLVLATCECPSTPSSWCDIWLRCRTPTLPPNWLRCRGRLRPQGDANQEDDRGGHDQGPGDRFQPAIGLAPDGEGQSQSPHGSIMQRWAEVGEPSADDPVLGAARQGPPPDDPPMRARP